MEIDEFQVRAHDGERLYGLRALCRLGGGSPIARVRVVGPSDRPVIDPCVAETGEAEFVLQYLAGRRLEDRVLDVLRVCQMARGDDAEHPRRVRLVAERVPDEFLIARHLLAEELELGRSHPLGDDSGFGTRP